jgi:5-methylcytosine-specific restriction endonuclease McrA
MSRNEQRNRDHKKQLRINQKLKRRLYKDVYMSPCFYCKEVFLIDNLTIEHITPLSFHGTNEDDNITLACAPCNQQRGRESWLLKQQINKERYREFEER